MVSMWCDTGHSIPCVAGCAAQWVLTVFHRLCFLCFCVRRTSLSRGLVIHLVRKLRLHLCVEALCFEQCLSPRLRFCYQTVSLWSLRTNNAHCRCLWSWTIIITYVPAQKWQMCLCSKIAHVWALTFVCYAQGLAVEEVQGLPCQRKWLLCQLLQPDPDRTV